MTTRARLVRGIALSYLVGARILAAPALDGSVALLRKGDVFVAAPDGTGVHKLASAAGPVRQFAFSRALGYVALLSDASITIVDLNRGAVAAELRAPEGATWSLMRWLPGQRLLTVESLGLVVGDLRVYDVGRGAFEEGDLDETHRLLDAAFDDGGKHMLTTDVDIEGGVARSTLSMTKLSDGTRRPLVSRRGNVLDPVFSHDGTHVAFFEVEWDTAKNHGTDVVWLQRLADGKLKELLRGPSRAKSAGVSYLAFSDDDRYLAMLTSPTTVIEIANPGAAQELPGGRACGWLDARHLMFPKAGGVSAWDVDHGTTRELVPDATEPVRLRRLPH